MDVTPNSLVEVYRSSGETYLPSSPGFKSKPSNHFAVSRVKSYTLKVEAVRSAEDLVHPRRQCFS